MVRDRLEDQAEHPRNSEEDNVAVDLFALDMKRKLAANVHKKHCEWAKVFATGKGARGMLAERVRVPQAELFEFMADTRNTLARVIERQEEQAKKIEQHDRRIAALEQARGLK